ncbi:amino acid adenylation domain-containing protein [Modestobacter sp. I12A-02628]|uniref:Amino acid adenylation domain-containing protein n=1 Tax=Goekera deserti TaxID=2497753 RepID=A0A7K3WFT3_9ACTN|nr:non-ribosomal peptide synthetase [Goekera deserti]MPQ96903.1 amino acid adenylation domain-containing protein [Goekera deserti]NDI46784.1 amino acid adenylation domain-containing protein [Goekera deserti]NEL54353.1 amino acid adenylation domain-containing protein [Goekera deserti]
MGGDRFATLVELIEHRATHDAERSAYRFLPDGLTETGHLTFEDVHRRATAIAAALQGAGAVGQRVLVTYPGQQLQEYVTSLLGCVMAGATAVPCDSPRSRGGPERFAGIAADCRPALVLGPSADIGLLGPLVADVRHLDVADVPPALAGEWRRPDVAPSSLALLQYTSGSTRSPRGVRVTHANVLANERAIAETCEHDRDSHFVGWLPLFHDMGMIANVLQPLYLGATSVLMPPAAFLAEPLRWLAAIQRHGGVAGGGPNFAFELCVSRIPQEQRADLDLSTWRTAFNGAEVVREATLDRFVRAFGPAGFAPESFFSCYGLAEATLIVAGAPRRRPPVVLAADAEATRGGRLVPAAEGLSGISVRPVVSSGRVVAETTVAIVDPGDHSRLSEGAIGEVWVRGPGVADGYWKLDAPRDDFDGFVAGDEVPYLRTGDLGALVEGELYIVGRTKDLIIVRGANHHPADIEWTIEDSTDAVRPSCIAVFADSDGAAGEERIVAVCEPASDDSVDRLPEISAVIRSAVARRHGLHLHDVVLAARGTVTKTTSGKVRRAACRSAYGAGSLRVLARSASETAGAGITLPSLPGVEDLREAPAASATLALADALVRVSGREWSPGAALGLRPSALGMDSVRAVELQHHVESTYGIRLPPFTLVGGGTLGSICEAIITEVRKGALPVAPSVEAGSSGPASLIQQGMLLEQELAPPGPAYVLTRALRLRGTVQVAALARAVARVQARHPALRTRLSRADGAVVQIEQPSVPDMLVVEPLTGDVQAAIDSEASRGMTTDGESLVRFLLLRRSGNDSVLVLRAHHAVLDFWSATLLVRELLAFYDEEAGGAAAVLPVPGPGPVVQAQLESALLTSPRGNELRTYWSARLADAPASSALPHPRPRGQVRLFHGGRAEIRIDERTTARVKELASGAGCTPFTVLLTALQVLVARLSGRRDVVVGTFAMRRDSAGLANSMGCLTNLVPVRVTVDPTESVAALLGRAGAGLAADLAHSALPFAETVRICAPDRDPGRLPLVQTAIVLQREPGRPDEGLRALALGTDGQIAEVPAGVRVEVLPVVQRWTHLDLTLNVAEMAGGLSVVAEYDESLHDQESAAVLLEQWATLVQHMADDPDAPVGRLPQLSARMLADAVAAGSGCDVPADPTPVHVLVDRRIAVAPDRVAVSMDRGDLPEHLSAAAAHRWARELAMRLRAAGAGPGTRVGILLDRCLALPVVLLAVHRVGAAYVPLDASDPAERIAWTADDGGVTVIVCDAAHVGLAPAGLPLVDVDPKTTREGSAEPAAPTHPELPAYVLYTSGSTGRQKGVVVPHRAVVNRLRWMQRALPLGTDDRVLQKTPISFDVSVWELFWPLIVGATLVMAPPGIQRHPDRLARLLRREQITVMHAVPTALTHLLPHLDQTEGEAPLALRRLVSSGESLTGALRDRTHRTISAELHNMYGPTEAAVDVTWWPCRRTDTGAVPIGRPIDGTEVYVVDRDTQPRPVGTIGEVAIAGLALAHGYRDRPAATAASWRPHAFGSRGARIYLTGDRGTRGRDGAIRFLGRADAQVSVGGRRVELGEVEEALRRAPGVRDAVVATEDAGHGVRLVGFVVPEQDDPGESGRIRAWLRQHLPAALVPSTLRLLPQLPATANGKLDRAALAERAREPSADPAPTPSTDPLVRRVASVWCSVLGVAAVDVDDDFYSLGGDSITALRVLASLQADGLHVTVAQLLANPSVGALARAVSPTREALPASPPPAAFGLCPDDVRALLPADAVDAYPASSAQLAVLFHQMQGQRHEVYVTSLHVRGALDPDRMRDAARIVSERHPYLRSSLDLTAHREPLQVVHRSLELPVQFVDLSPLPVARADALLSEWQRSERTRPFDVEKGPLARVTVHVRHDRTWQLTLSSFALDGWATATVLTELLSAHASGKQLAPPPQSDYRHFVALEEAAVSDPAHRDFWARELDDVPAVRLPPPSSGGTAGPTTRRVEIPMSQDTARAMGNLARRLHVSERTLLLSAHLRVVQALTGAPEALTGVEWSGRPEEPDGDRVVGVFNNILPLRVPLTGSWTDLVQATAEAERRAAPFRRYPLARLERDLGRPGLLQTMYVHTHFHLYRDLEHQAAAQILDSWAPDRTYIPLTAHTNVDAHNGQIRLLLDYDPAEVDDHTIRLAAELYPRVWQAMISDPDAPCTAVPVVDGARLRAQLAASDGGDASAGPASAFDLILQQARRTPDRIAVRSGAVQYSYRELVERAVALAAVLVGVGVQPDAVVAVPARRTPDLLISLLGVWEAGAAYLPIDPTEPALRVRSMCATAQVTHAVALGNDPLAAVVAAAVPPRGQAVPAAKQSARDGRLLAYVLPTSGSTGAPKLVGVPQDALVNYLLWSAASYGGAGRTPVHSPVEFDLTVTSLLTPLVAGGTVELLPENAGPEAIGQVAPHVDGIIKITPAHLAVVADQLRTAGERAPAACVVVGGEALAHQHVTAWRKVGGSGPIINEYGPTEATVGCITWRIEPGQDGSEQHGSDIPIGRPIAGTRARVLLASEVLPDTVTGELAVGGRGLARGYVGSPGRTAVRFVPDPLGRGERLYLTGDWARRDRDGLLHVQGRRDRQVKVRGRRVEPAATEAVLRSHPQVREAAVTTVHGSGGRRQLVGYWVSDHADVPGEAALRTWLRRQLAPHQIPDVLMWLPLLPLTTRGKTDVSALPDPREGAGPAIAALVSRMSDEDVAALLGQGAAGPG